MLFLAQPRTAQPRAVDGRVALAVHTHSTSPTHPRTAGTPGVRPAQDAVMGIYPNTHLQRDMQQIHRCKGTLPETSHTHTHTRRHPAPEAPTDQKHMTQSKHKPSHTHLEAGQAGDSEDKQVLGTKVPLTDLHRHSVPRPPRDCHPQDMARGLRTLCQTAQLVLSLSPPLPPPHKASGDVQGLSTKP